MNTQIKSTEPEEGDYYGSLERSGGEWDLIVIGAGPAGLYCAINSSGNDRKILILEKMESPGRKLLISGSGRCNITHDGDIKSFLNHYGDSGRFLRPALLGFTNRDLIAFLQARGLSVIRQEGGKVFPETQSSRDVLKVLTEECRARNIDIQYSKSVSSVTKSENGFYIACEDRTYRSDLLVIATGGRSYPATGSSGDGYEFAKSLGHIVTEIGPALTPVYIKEHPFSQLAGISFPDAKVSIFRDEKLKEHRGEVLLTHEGLSGPGILDFSRYIRTGDILKLSFLAKSVEDLDRWVVDRSRVEGTRNLRSKLADLSLPARFVSRLLEILGIPQDIKLAHTTKEMRIALADHLTGFPLVVEKLEGFDSAMVTRGGVDRNEINSKTMESKLVKGLYFVGEVLDVDGDTGGYNLQAAFSTGILAARSIKERFAPLKAPSELI